MPETIQTRYLSLSCDLSEVEIGQYRNSVTLLHEQLKNENEYTGWLSYPLEENEDLIARIEGTASEIRQEADILIVIGIGGSILGARAIVDAITPNFCGLKQGTELIYVGHNMSGSYLKQLLHYIVDKRIYVNVISKSGGTMETALAFRVIRQYMEEKYGYLEASRRIIVTTDAEKGVLREIAMKSGYSQFNIPKSIGGRFSVFTPVGLLPAAVSGIKIRDLMIGARLAAENLSDSQLEFNDAYKYAVMRHILYRQGYKIELLASFEPSLNQLHEWWKQLFGESEGKDRKGLFPSTVSFSTDLHSMGQFIQEGSPILFETVIHFKKIEQDFIVNYDFRNEDGLNYLVGKTMNEINTLSKEGTVFAHAEGGVPVIQIELPKLDAFHIGYLMYFFMKSCAMSAYLLQVNPFDQPGVEAYKRKMLELLQ